MILHRPNLLCLSLALGACASTPDGTSRASMTDAATPLAGLVAESPTAASPTLGPRAREGAAADAKKSPWSATLQARSYSETDFDDLDADLEITRFGAELGYEMPVETGLWKFHFGVEESEYDVGDLGTFDDSSEVGVGAVYIHPGPEWSWFATLNVNDGTGEDADFGDGTYVEGGGGFTYTVNDTLKLGLAVVGRTELEEDTDAIPFPIVEWTISDRQRIGFVRSSDPALGWTFDVNEETQWYISLATEQRQYRIDKDEIDDAAFVDEETGLRTGLIYRNSGGFTGEVFAGAAKRELSLDIDGDEEADEDLDAGAFFGAAVTFGF